MDVGNGLDHMRGWYRLGREDSSMSEGPHSIEALTLEWVARTGQDTTVACPRCRYLLSGIQEARCPECGEEFRVGVRVASLLDVPFMVGLIVLGLAAAPALGMTIVFWSLVPFQWDQMLAPRNYTFMYLSAIEILLWAGLIVGWCFLRKALCRRHVILRWILILLFIVLGVAGMFLLLWSV